VRQPVVPGTPFYCKIVVGGLIDGESLARSQSSNTKLAPTIKWPITTLAIEWRAMLCWKSNQQIAGNVECKIDHGIRC